ncbi:MAG TPA: NAD(P)-binding domain-containing protein [Gaiellaceae bacterium]|nr:NAD(P)-binding domain-containing protein [Gaiellaceae bacterium]
MNTEAYETIVIGGGQAGLSVGYHLAERHRQFVILDENERVGDAWRKRWDSLRLFTPARFNGLPGMPFEAPRWSFPTKDEMADYLEAYAERFALPVRTGVKVERVVQEDGRFVVSLGDEQLEAPNVVVATGAHRVPKLPAFAAELDQRIVQLHSADYRNPLQLQDGAVLVVGVGNSGAEIAYELADTHRCLLAGANHGQIPVQHGSRRSRMMFRAIRFFGHHVARTDTRIGRKVGPKVAAKGPPLIRRKEADFAAVGIERIGRVAGVQDGLPVLEDGRLVEVANVVWCTGFRTDFSWIDVPAFDGDGRPLHERGVVGTVPGLYFAGLVFQYSLTSDVLPNGGRDAEHVARHIAARQAKEPAGATTLTEVFDLASP